ncbi:Hsp20/alpha crystallin family protein, partial [Candidatus Peregrinibacteria bacterium]|nr:Hsp20/alpha crystallin family protein [Candidatus Peregrinibacteria bacterium]
IPAEETHELAIDIYETEDKIYIVAPLAGVKSKDISINIDESTVHIKGSRTNPFEEHENKLYSSECFWGKFERKFTLPNSVDTRDISATFRNGILLLETSRIAPSGQRKITIH